MFKILDLPDLSVRYRRRVQRLLCSIVTIQSVLGLICEPSYFCDYFLAYYNLFPFLFVGAPPPGGYYPAQPGAPGQGPPTTVVVTQPTVAVVQTFRESPVHTRCPHCQAEVVTGTMYETGTFAWIICVVLCVIGYVIYGTSCLSLPYLT